MFVGSKRSFKCEEPTSQRFITWPFKGCERMAQLLCEWIQIPYSCMEPRQENDK